jgi:GH25 family lysozyme M1 (1,4-beta-N-acetylmuramidase)
MITIIVGGTMQNKTMFSTFGADINEYKEGVNFTVLARTIDFLYLRASGSGSGRFRVDTKFIEFARGSRSVGIPVGAYHYALPSADYATADSQCDAFIGVLQDGFGQGDYGDLFPVLDVEAPTNKTITTTQLVNWVDRFRKRFESKTRRRLMLYTGVFFVNLYDDLKVPGKGYPLSNMPLWIAMYKEIAGNPPVPPDIGGWKRWRIWQYTEKGDIPGVTPPVDLNYGPDSIDMLMPPTDVKGLYARTDNKNIYVSWTKNRDKDLLGYNLFVNSNYAGTVGVNDTYYVIPRSKFNLPAGRPIEIGIEAFDFDGDFSKKRSKFLIQPTRSDDPLEYGTYFDDEYFMFGQNEE